MQDQGELLWMSIFKLARHLGGLNLAARAGCWEVDIDGRWYVAANGHAETARCSHGTEVPPYHVYLEYNGWPVGLLSPGGGFFAAGACANPEAFSAAVDRRCMAA